MAAASNLAPSPGAISEPATVSKPQDMWRENLNMQLICRECKEFPPNLVEEFSSGDMVCETCGLVLGDRIVDTRSEWRTFSNDDQGNDDPSRVGDGANPLLNGSQLQTTISFGDGSNSRSRDLHRAQNKSTHDKSTKGLLAAYKEIGALCDAMHIPKNVSDTAKHLFKMVNDAGAFRGKSQDTIIAGCIFIACRQCKVPRTFREIFALTKVSKAEIGRIFKSLEKFFAAQNKEKMDSVVQAGGIVNPEDNYTTTRTTTAKELCIRFCSQLGLNNRCTMMSQELAGKMDGIGSLAGRSPLSIAGACIYMASHLMGQSKSAKDISAVAGVSDGTIRHAYKLIYPDREKFIDPKWFQDGKSNMSKLPPA
ncbi:transcription initiation factor IIB [Sticta canariensis]|nr:transcription initiation factor IIB [Sticta canariensis]